MASFDGEKHDDHCLDETYINETSEKKTVDLIVEILNTADDAESITFDSSYSAKLNSLLDKDAKNVKNPSTTEKELPMLNNIEQGEPEKIQIQFHPQSTQSPRRNESERNIKDHFYTDQDPSTSYQYLRVSNVSTNFTIPSISNDAQNQVTAKETSLICTFCGIMYSSKNILNLHLASENKIRKYMCEPCELVFAYEYQLDKHNSTFHNVPSISNNAQNKNPAKKMNSTSLTCNYSGLFLYSKLSLNCHLANEHNIGKYKCVACDRLFAYEYQVTKHNNAHHKAITK